jgi:hypothetical protein
MATAVVVDGSGNVFVTGSSVGSGANKNDYATIAYSGAGVALWTNRYDGPVNGDDYATAVAVDGSGSVFVAGSSRGSGGVDSDYATIAYSGAGVALWTNRYNGPGNVYDAATAVATDGSGNVFVTGYSVGSGGVYSDYATIAYSGAGVALWTNRYNGPGNWDAAKAVATDGRGNVFVTGDSLGSGRVDSDFATIAYSSAGVALWTNRYNGPGNGYDAATAVATDGSGNVVVTGISDRYPATIKYSGAGVPLWINPYDGSASAVAVDGSGNVLVTGSSYDNASDYLTIKYSGAGVPLWTNRYNGSASAVAVDGSGNVFVTGSSPGSGGHSDYATIAYSGAGMPLWTNRYDGSGNGHDIATAVVVDGSGNVFVTGSSPGSGGYSDYATIAYSGAGVPLWTNRYNGPGDVHDAATAMAVDASGNVVVTGTSYGTNDDHTDYYTAKYSGADGSVLWQQRYTGAAGAWDEATAVAVDGSGNVVVTGRSSGPDSGLDYNPAKLDYYTAKYAAADGTLLWEKRYNGPANLYDSATAVAVDASGNVVVTGHVDAISSFASIQGGDYYTAKYAAADGATLWEKRFNRTSPAGRSPCLALGPNGMIVVSGNSSGDYATVVYRDLPALSIDRISTGVRLRVTGLPGRSYSIERTPAVTGPWGTINTQTAPASGLFEYLDPNPPSAAAFYRTSEP